MTEGGTSTAIEDSLFLALSCACIYNAPYFDASDPQCDLSVSALWRYDSGRVFSLAARNQGLAAVQRSILAASGYPDAPSSVGNHVFFSERGSETFPGYGVLDTSINYDILLFRTLRPWLKLELYK